MARRFLTRLVAVTAGVLLLVVAALFGFRLVSQARETASRVDAAPTNGQFITAADVGIYVQEAGPPGGVPVVLIHGLGAWSETWRPTIDALAMAGYRVIALDLPPFGFSVRRARHRGSGAERAAARPNPGPGMRGAWLAGSTRSGCRCIRPRRAGNRARTQRRGRNTCHQSLADRNVPARVHLASRRNHVPAHRDISAAASSRCDHGGIWPVGRAVRVVG